MIGIFLDRDGTITKKTDLVTDEAELVLEEAAAEGIRALNKMGKVIVVTNQPQIARGLVSEADVDGMNRKMVHDLERHGARIDAVYFCPHHPEMHPDVPEHAKKYRISCQCRKPDIGMMKQAALDLSLDLSKSFVIGDRTVDILSGKNAGCKTILVRTGHAGRDGKHDVKADYEVNDLAEAADIIRKSLIKVLILAGGKGERLMPLTKDIPKPMVLIANRPALQHHIELAKKHGFDDIVICASYKADKIIDYFSDGRAFGVRINYPLETEQLGSGGAIKNASEFLDCENFIVLNGDVMTDIDLTDLVKAHLENDSIATMVVRLTDHPKDSDVVRLNGNIIVEYIGRGQEKEVTGNTGLMVLNRRILSLIPKGFSNIEKDIVFKLVGKEKICGYLSSAYIKDFGTPERLESVRRHMEDNA
jgi:histidinol-phosphate phosphatase family protein